VGRSEDVVRYGPAEIAKVGPIVGLQQSAWEERHLMDKFQVFGKRGDGPDCNNLCQFQHVCDGAE
jgi:hypothetical protein